MINYKINKYINKLNINPRLLYANRLLNYMSVYDPNKIHIMEGGSIKYGDCDSIITFLKEKCSKVIDITKNKYIVILYGPPGSGKSLARKIACHVIKIQYDETASENEIEKDFIDTGIDEITYDISDPSTGKEVRTLLTENLKKHLLIDKDKQIDTNLYLDRIKKDPKLLNVLGESSFQIYKNNRKDSLSEMLYYFAISINKNIFMELASPQTDYLDRILALITYYNYIPIFIYPFVSKSSILCDRAVKRGLQEGRFLKCKGSFSIEDAMKKCLDGYENMKKIINKYKKYYILQYNADFDTDTFNEINAYNFKNLDEYELEEEYNVEKTIEKNKLLTVNNIFKNINYDKIVKLNFDSTY
jgi:hypothetical protein